MKKKISYLLLLIFFSCSLLIEGCGCGKKTDGESVEGEQATAENGENGEAPPPQEAARTNVPPAAAKPPATPQRPPQGGAKTSAAENKGPKKKPIPKDRFLPIEFDTKEAALIPVTQNYTSRVRRNIFRDIKSSINIRKLAEEAIVSAKKEIQIVKKLPAGTVSETFIKQAEDNLKQAEEAFKSQNYMKARAVAVIANDLASKARPKAEEQTVNRGMDYFYKGFYQMGEEKTGMITRKNLEDDSETLLLVTTGQKIEENLSAPISIDNPDGSQRKVYKREYLIDEITEDNIVMSNLTEPNKPPVKIAVTKPETDSDSKDKNSKDGKNKDNKDNKNKDGKEMNKQTPSSSAGRPASNSNVPPVSGSNTSYDSNATRK